MPNKSRASGDSSTPQAAMVRLMVAAGRLQQAVEEACRGHGLTHDQYNVLRILRGVHPEGHPRYAISERLIRRAPDVTRLLTRLVKQGLVERYRADEDQRLSMSRITRDGLRLLDAVDPGVGEVHERFATGLGPERLALLSEVCDHIAGRAEP